MLWHLATWHKKADHHNRQKYHKYTKLSWWKEPAVIDSCLIYSVPACVFDSSNEFSFSNIGRPIENVNNGVPEWMLLLIASCFTSSRLNMVRFMDFQVSNVRRRSGIAAKSWNKSTYACWAAFCLFEGPPWAGLSKKECVCVCKVMDDYRLGLPRPELDSSPYPTQIASVPSPTSKRVTFTHLKQMRDNKTETLIIRRDSLRHLQL